MDCDAGLRLAPNDARLDNNRGSAYAVQGKLDQTIADYNAALRIQPDYADAQRNRAGAMEAKSTGRNIHGR